MKVLMILFTSMLASCGTLAPAKKMTVDPRLQDDVINFLVDCERNLPYETCNPLLDVHLKVGKLPEKESLGVCITYGGDWSYKRVIIISPHILGAYNQKLVTYHELSHCILGMEHYDEEIDIMNSYEYSSKTQYLGENWDYFTTIMFKRGAK